MLGLGRGRSGRYSRQWSGTLHAVRPSAPFPSRACFSPSLPARAIGWAVVRRYRQSAHRFRARGSDGIENHRGWIAVLLGNDMDLIAFSPADQLFARGGAKGVARREQDRFALALHIMHEFANAGCFTGAVDARHQYRA